MSNESQSMQNSSLGAPDTLITKQIQISSDRNNEMGMKLDVPHQGLKSDHAHQPSYQSDSNIQVDQTAFEKQQQEFEDIPNPRNQKSLFQENELDNQQAEPKQSPEPSTNQTEILKPQTIQDYRVIKFMGKGSFGQVFLVESSNKTQFAIKTFHHITAKEHQKIRKQAKIMFSVEHPNVMDAKYFFPYNNQKSLAIVLQYCPDGDLRNFLGKLTPKKILEIELQINKGLRYLHNKGIIHKDIKLQNILMKNGKPKLSDLGLAELMKVQDEGNFLTRWVTGWLSEWVGTRSYMSPEVFHGARYSKEADIWSLGIVMLQLCTGKRITQLTEEKNQEKEKLKPAQIQGFPSKDILEKIKDEQMRAMVEGMLQRDPSKRTSLEDIEKKIEEKKTQDYNKLEDDLSEKLPSVTGQELVNLFEGNVKFPNIEKVCLVQNELNDQVLKAFAQNGEKFPLLRQVIINSDSVSDKGLKQLTQNGAKFSNLKILRLGSENITDSGLKIMLENGENFRKLQFVVFGNNKITENGKNERSKYRINFQIFF